MLEAIRRQILRFLKVPAEPRPPFGAPGSIRAFRAGRNYYYLKLTTWGLAQVGTLAGIIFWIAFVDRMETRGLERIETREAARQAAAVEAASAPAAQPEVITPPPEKTREERRAERRERVNRRNIKEQVFGWFAWMPQNVYFYITIIEYLGLLAFVAQLPVTFLIIRLDFEYRWYIVTDRSLRIRHGIMKLEEATMSFANIQQVDVTQGPIQRLLGIADVRVQSAGGGGGDEEGKDSMHRGVFHGVDNAPEIRDFILERLRKFREAGLGDPDDSHSAPAETGDIPPVSTLEAAREVLAEVRALRSSI